MKQQFFNHLENHFQANLEGTSPLQKAIRRKAWDRFVHLGLPEKKHPGYQYFPFNQFYQETFELASLSRDSEEMVRPYIYPECRQSHVIFVNGHYCPEISDVSGLPQDVVILRLRDALSNYGNFLQGRLSRSVKEEEDPFAALNIALIQMGLFFYVPPHIKIDRPIQCLHVITNDHPIICNPRIHFFLGKQSRVEWIYEHQCFKDFEYFSNSVIDIALEEGAHFEQLGTLKPCPHGWCIESMRATLKRDSQFKSFFCTSGTKAVRQDYRVSLMGENASCDLKGISALTENKQSHVNVLMEHLAPHCHSNQLFKTIVTDTARSSFEGKILVRSKAQKTQAYQLNQNLVLAKRAFASSKPNLEIFADDVKASHGATVTQLNEEHLLYLKMRGICESGAKKLLLSGFSLDILSEITNLHVREKMQQLTEKCLK